MGVAASRLLVAVCVAGIAGGGVAAAAPAASRAPGPAPCTGHVAARFTDAATEAAAHRVTVVLSSTGNTACTLAGFPALVLPSALGAPLPAGHLTLAADVVLAPRSPAAFGIRYSTSQTPAASCSVGIVVNGQTAAVEGTLPLAACASIVQLDVTAYASGTQPPVVLPPPAPSTSLTPCAARDLALREVWTPTESEFTSGAIYALQNHGSACRISGNVGIRLLDAGGQEYPIPSVPRRTMALLLPLAPGEEASFTLSYPGLPRAACATAPRVEVYVATDPTPITGAVSATACRTGRARISDLRIGVPIAPSVFGPG